MAVSSDHLYESLTQKGLVPNKSYDMAAQDSTRLWDSLPHHLKWSFLRGFLDGDGHVRFFRQSNPGQTFSCKVGWLGHKHFLDKIAAFLEQELGYKPSVRPRGSELLHGVLISKPDVGLEACRRMLVGYQFPFGHPAKTTRMFEHLSPIETPFASWGDPNFQMIIPPWVTGQTSPDWLWAEALDTAEQAYSAVIKHGWSPQQARSVLPNSTKTEIVVTANLREWRLVFNLRTSAAAHPQMREVMIPLLKEFQTRVPVLFEDISPKEPDTCSKS